MADNESLIRDLSKGSGLEKTNELRKVRLDCESTRYVCRPPAQVRIVLIVAEALHNCAGQSFRRRGISWSKMTIYSIDEPFRNASYVKSHSRQAFQSGLHSNYSERFGPDAWHDQQIGSIKQSAKFRSGQPACKLDADIPDRAMEFSGSRFP